MKQPRSSRLHVEGLVCLAVLILVAGQSLPNHLPGGFLGIDILLVVLGYLVSSRILRQTEDGTFSVSGFYRETITSVLPILILVLSGCLLLGAFILWPREYSQLGHNTLATAGFIQNYVYANEFSINVQKALINPLAHLWPLAVAAHLYFIWPLILRRTAHLKLALPLLIGALILASFGTNVFLASRDLVGSFYFTHSRAWQFLVGSAVAWVIFAHSQRLSSCTPSVNYFVAMVGVLTIACAVWTMDGINPSLVWWSLLITLGTAAIIISGSKTVVGMRLLPNFTYRFFWKICLPLYFWYWPLLSFARIASSNEPSLEAQLLTLLTAIALAILTYGLIAKTSRYYKSTMLSVLLLSILAALATNAYLIVIHNGLGNRFPSIVKALQEVTEMKKRNDCSELLNLPGRCLTNHKALKTAVLDDDPSMSTFFALEHYYKNSDIGLIGLGKKNCPALSSLKVTIKSKNKACLRASESYLNWVTNNPQITTVFLSSRTSQYIRGRNHGYSLTFRQGSKVKRKNKAYRAALEETLKRLTNSGKEVIYVLEWPYLPFAPQECIEYRNLQFEIKQKGGCRLFQEDFQRAAKNSRSLINSVLRDFPGIGVWDASRAFCRKGDIECKWILNGRPLYQSSTSLSQAGTRFLGNRLKIKNKKQPSEY